MSDKERENISGKDVSIECAKAYVSDAGDRASLEALRKKTEELQRENKTYSTVLLVDDISYQDKAFNFDEYAAWLGRSGHEEAKIYRESQLIHVCDLLHGMIDRAKLTPELNGAIQNDENYSSEFFIAAWFLLRLGQVESPIFPARLRASMLYNILPESFKPGEDRSLDIIRATPFANAIDQITYEFIGNQD